MNRIVTDAERVDPSLAVASPQTPEEELIVRQRRLREEMAHACVLAVVCTSRQNVEYFSGYQTGSWASNTRPVYLVIDPDCVVLIGSATEERNIARYKRTFTAKHYDGFVQDGVALLSDHLRDIGKEAEFIVGLDYGQDMFGRGSMSLLQTAKTDYARFVECDEIIWRVRMIKSRYEAEMKRASFTIVNRAFDAVLRTIRIGMTEVEVYRRLQAELALNGADGLGEFTVLFGNGEFSYNRPPTEKTLEVGHYLWTDFRSTYAGYPGDRNRIARAGQPSEWEVRTYKKIRELTETLSGSIEPGMTGGDVFAVFEDLWSQADVGPLYLRASRIGHGGGLDLTEPPSLMKSSKEVIEEGMILHIEPKLESRGAVFQFEEIIWVQNGKNEFLSDPHPLDLPVITEALS